MAGFGGYNNRPKFGPTGRYGGGKTQPGQSGSLGNYGNPLSQYSQTMTGPTQLPNPNLYQGMDANYIRNIPTAYTPEQVAQMKTAATNVQAAGNRGMTDKIRELMAAQGLSGSGAETGALSNATLKSNANLNNTMSGIDISNAQTNLANQYNKAVHMNQLLGLGLGENQQYINMDQFNKDLYSNMYRWGKEFDYGKYRDDQSYGQYQDQLALMMKMLGLGGGGYGGGYGGLPNPNRAG